MMKRRASFIVYLLVMAAIAASAQTSGQRRPNIVLIFPDNAAWARCIS
jgi:hypothetical protein